MVKNAELLVDENTDEICDYQLAHKRKNQRGELEAIFWLAKEMGMTKKAHLIFDALDRIENDEILYRQFFLEKKSGGRREVCAPNKDLKTVQKGLNRIFASYIPRQKNVFGFSGGSIVGAIKPHLNSKVILGVDCKNAFGTVSSRNLLHIFSDGRKHRIYYDDQGKRCDDLGTTLFSWHVSRILLKLVTFKDCLPPGAPTSPRLFDAAFLSADQKLVKLAQNVGGTYTRYADNIFFSLRHKDKFDGPLFRAILRAVGGVYTNKKKPDQPRIKGIQFECHKLRVVKTEKKAVRMLGLNIIDETIHNTRSFKRKLRLMIHHLLWLLKNGVDFENEWEQLHGMMQFAQIETLPPRLVEDYRKLEKILA